MAEATNIYEDLDELCSDNDELSEKFYKAANHLQSLVSRLDNQTLFKLYGFYKQSLEGCCSAPKPSWYDVKGKSKWEAWKKLGNMPCNDAKMKYIQEIERLDPSFKTNNLEDSKEGWVTVSTFLKEESPLMDKDKTIVDFAKENNVLKVGELLSSYNINDLDAEGLALIHWAADCGSYEVAEFLIAKGADINIIDSDGQTALHYASSCGHIECVCLLLKKGADRFKPDADGSTPLDVANNERIANILANAFL